MKSPSIRRTLLIRCGIGVGSLLCLLCATIYLLVRHSLYREVDDAITQTAALLANQVELENGGVTFEWQEGLGSNNALIPEALFQFWNERTGAITRSPALHARDLPKFQGPDGKPLMKSIVLPDGSHGRAIGLRVIPFVLPEEMERMRGRGTVIDPKSLPHTLVVAGNIEPIQRTLDQLQFILASGTLLTLALGFTLIDRAIRVSLGPINALTRQIHERTEHQLDSALTLPGGLPSELKGLAHDFGSLLARVAITRDRERDFIRHAAHELRTPIAGLRATTELALSKPRDATSYAGYLAACGKSAEELGELVKRLSALARIGRTATPTAQLETLAAGELVAECLPSFVTAAKSRGIEILSEPFDPELRFTGDWTLCRIILNNLLDNAVCYTPENGTVRIHCERRDGLLRIAISNPAPLLAGDPSRLFEPLFRHDESANAGETHLGIGLTLSLDAAHAMGASLKAGRIDDGWIEFVLSLPVLKD